MWGSWRRRRSAARRRPAPSSCARGQDRHITQSLTHQVPTNDGAVNKVRCSLLADGVLQVPGTDQCLHTVSARAAEDAREQAPDITVPSSCARVRTCKMGGNTEHNTFRCPPASRLLTEQGFVAGRCRAAGHGTHQATHIMSARGAQDARGRRWESEGSRHCACRAYGRQVCVQCASQNKAKRVHVWP